jgi:hypothetical protein
VISRSLSKSPRRVINSPNGARDPHSLARALCWLAVVAALLVTPSVAWAQASASISISLPDAVILHYFRQVRIDIDSQTLRDTLLYGVDEAQDEGTASGVGSTVDLGIATFAGLGPVNSRRVPVVLRNAFAVRSLSDGGRSQIEINMITNRASHVDNPASSIRLRRLRVEVNGDNRGRVRFDSPGLANPQYGDVHFQLDFQRADYAGLYRGARIELVAENI